MGEAAYGQLIVMRLNQDNACQLWMPIASDTLYSRRYYQSGGGWQPWRPLFSRHNLVGAVSQTAGVPTGRVVERGSNANGEYVRFADGTQICTAYLNLPFAAGAYVGVVWSFPAVFAVGSTPTVCVATDSSAWTNVPAGLARGDGAPMVGNVSNALAVPQWHRRTGAPDFVAGNTIGVHAQATGRWF
ncbi:hypothetical protein MASR1M32_12270 [Rhodobacter sp.]